MGVTGLWQVLEPVGRPVRLETLEGKVLAVDVSIWLHQALKGMRDRDGNPVQNAHLISLFNKVCKLLFYRIKPVFVFDGGVPALKKKTLAGRKERKEQAERESQKTAKKMMSNFLKSYAMQQLMGGGKDNLESINLPFPSQTEPDMFELPPLPIRKEEDPSDTDSSEEEFYQSHLQNLNDVDIDSADFKSLPSELQHEILTEMKETRKRNFLATMEELPEDSSDFSSYQMKKLLNQNKLSSKIEDVRREMNEQQTGEITQGLGEDYYGACDVESRRVVSDDTSHYILIKGLAKKRKQHALAMRKEEERLNDLRKYFEDIDDEKDNILPKSRSQVSDSGMKNGEQKKVSTLSTLAADIYETSEPQPSTSGLQLRQADFQSGVVVLDDESDEDDDTNQGDSKDKIMNWVKATQGQGHSKTPVSMATEKTDAVMHVERNLLQEDNLDSDQKPFSTDRDVPNDVGNRFKVMGDAMHKETVAMETNPDNGSSLKVSLASDKETISTPHIERPLHKEEKNVHNLAQRNGHLQDSKNNDGSRAEGSEAFVSDVKINETSFSDSITHEKHFFFDNRMSNQVDEKASPEPAFQEPSAIEGIVTGEGVKTEESSQREGTGTEPLVVPDEGESDDDDGEFIEIPEMSTDITFSRSLSQVNEYADEGPNVISMEAAETTMEEEERAAENFRAQLKELKEDGYRDFQYELQEEAVTLQAERGKQARLAMSIGDQIYAEAQELLQLFGLPYLVSPMEAEAQCAYLDLSGQTHGTITDDSDVWLFGGRRVYKNFFNKGKLVEFFKIEDCESQFGLDRDKLINIALLCGSDYTYGIKGVGPVTAMEIMAEFPGQQQEGLKAFKKWWRKAHKEPAQMSDTKLQSKLRQVPLLPGFPDTTVVEAYQNPEVDESEESFTWGMPELDSIRDFTQDRLGWTKAKTDEILLPVLKQLNKPSTQGRITSFFTPVIHPTPSRKPQSKRMKKTLQKMKEPQGSGESSTARKTPKSSKPPVKKVLKKVCLSESSSSDSESEGSADESVGDSVVMAAMFDDEFEEDVQQSKNKTKPTQNSKQKKSTNSKGKSPLNKTKKSKTVSKSATAKEKTAQKKSKFTKRALSSHMPL